MPLPRPFAGPVLALLIAVPIAVVAAIIPSAVLAPGTASAAEATAATTSQGSASGLGHGVVPVAGIPLRPVTDGPALGTRLDPRSVASDGRGGFFVGDGNGLVHHVDADGALRIVAGDGRSGSPRPGPALRSPLPMVFALCAAGDGTVFLSTGQQVWSVSPSGTLRLVAGDGTSGAPAAGSAVASPLGNVASLAVAADGTLLLGDVANHQLLAVDPSGRLTSVAGTGRPGAARPGDALRSPLTPHGLGTAPDGSVLIASHAEVTVPIEEDVYTVEHRYPQVLRLSPENRLTVLAGTGESGEPAPGPATSAAFRQPVAVTATPDGAVYVADSGARVVVSIKDGLLQVVAGNGDTAGSGQEGAGRAVALQPSGLSSGPGGVLVSDSFAGAVSRLDAEDVLTVVAGSRYVAPHAGPALESSLSTGAMTYDGRRGLIVHDRTSRTVQLITPDGDLVHLLGNGERGTPREGPALASPLHGISAMAVGADGSLYLVDKPEFLVLRLTPTGQLDVVGHTPGSPAGVAVDAAGTVYYANCFHGEIESIAPGGGRAVVLNRSSVLPRGLDARVFNPFSTISAPDGTLYTYDGGNGAVLRVDPQGRVSSVAGTGSGTALDRRLGVSELALAPDGSVLLATGGDLWRIGEQVTRVVSYLDRPMLRRGVSHVGVDALTVDDHGMVYVGSELSSTVNALELDVEPPPDSPVHELRADGLTVRDRGARSVVLVRVTNLGHQDEPDLEVALMTGARTRDVRTVDIDQGATLAVRFRVHPRVARHLALRGVVDPQQRVVEEDERNNVVSVGR